MKGKNLALVGNLSEEGSVGNFRSINNALLSYSRRFNAEFIKMERAADDLEISSRDLRIRTAVFNNTLDAIESSLDEIIKEG